MVASVYEVLAELFLWCLCAAATAAVTQGQAGLAKPPHPTVPITPLGIHPERGEWTEAGWALSCFGQRELRFCPCCRGVAVPSEAGWGGGVGGGGPAEAAPVPTPSTLFLTPAISRNHTGTLMGNTGGVESPGLS